MTALQPSINQTLAGLSEVIAASLAPLSGAVAVVPYAPVVVAGTTTFPLVGVTPGTYIVEETASILRGNRPKHESGKGNSIYTIVLLWAQSLGNATTDGGPVQQALFDATDAIVNSFKGDARVLRTSAGEARAQDAGAVIMAHYPPQGPPLNYRNAAYVGCLITLEVWELYRPG